MVHENALLNDAFTCLGKGSDEFSLFQMLRNGCLTLIHFKIPEDVVSRII